MKDPAGTVERLLGTCPICDGTYKVRLGAMVHHGFKRPGDGFIHGDCFAVGHPPYEVSCEVTKVYRSQIMARREGLVTTLAPFKTGTVYRFVTTEVRRTGWETKLIEVEYVIGVTDPYVFGRAHDYRMRDLEYRLRMHDAEIERLNRLVEAWEPKDIKTVTELKLQADKAAREAKAAERQAKKDERAREAAEKKARQEQRLLRQGGTVK